MQHDLYVNNLAGDLKANPRDFYRYINRQKTKTKKKTKKKTTKQQKTKQKKKKKHKKKKKKNRQGISPLKNRGGNGVVECESERAGELLG